MFPPGCRSVAICETPSFARSGFPFDSAQMANPRNTAKIKDHRHQDGHPLPSVLHHAAEDQA